jgi:hypothetical protein
VTVSPEKAVDETSHTPLQSDVILLWDIDSLISKGVYLLRLESTSECNK